MVKLLLLFLFISVSSCEGILYINGTVVDTETGKAVPGAKVELLNIPPKQYYDTATNSLKDSIFYSRVDGNFQYTSRMMGLVFGIPPYHFRITKEGYNTLNLAISKKERKRQLSSGDSILRLSIKK